MDLSQLRFTKSHEWAKLDGELCTVGVTDFAVEQLTDVTNLELPKVGKAVTAGKPFGEIESVKAVFDLNSPVTGAVAEVNDALRDALTTVTEDPYGKGWMLRIRVPAGSSLDHLMTHDEYKHQIASEGH